MIFYIILAFSTFFISLIGTRLVILTLKSRIPAPDIALITGKKKSIAPDNGGIALVFSIIIGFLGTEIKTIYEVIPSIFLLTGIPLLSGLIKLHPSVKLVIRIVALCIPVSIFSKPVFSGYFPPFFDKFLAVCLWLWIIQVFEKIDSVEGLLSIEIISIGAGLLAIAVVSGTFFSPLSIQALIFIMAGCGFLWWSYFPAKVIAGEIASVPVGFIAGYLFIIAINSGYGVAAFIIFAYPLADSFITFFNNPFPEKTLGNVSVKPQELRCFLAIKNSNSPKWIVYIIAGTNMLLGFLAVQTIINPQMAIFYLVIAYSMVFTVIWFFTRVRNKTLP